MNEVAGGTIEFVLNGESYTLSRADVQARLVDAEPEPIAKYSVQVGDAAYPVRQVLALSIARSKKEFNTHTAARHLHALGFTVKPTWPPQAGAAECNSESELDLREPAAADDEEWHTEVEVQATVARSLERSGWAILFAADTVSKQPGVDIVARRGAEMIGVEVKGYPSTTYADPAKAHLAKRTHPATQARHWFAGALLAAVRLHDKKMRGLDGKHDGWRNVIALPDFQTYRSLAESIQGSLASLGVEVWWVRRDGSVKTR